MRIAYLINQYPKVSHSFIRREIRALERQGVVVERYSLRGWADELADPEDLEEREKTQYVLRVGAPALAAALLRAVMRRRLSFSHAFATAIRLGLRSQRGVLRHLAYLVEACILWEWCHAQRVDHLHAHFGTNPAAIALLLRLLGGPPYSFTVHGPEEFDAPVSLSLNEKIRYAAFVVTVSSFGRSQLFRWVGHGEWGKIQVVHCGIDEMFRCSYDTTGVAAPRLVCVGRLCEQKGQLLLIEALKQLASRGVAFEMVLAGDGELRSEVQELVATHGLQARVRITGWLSNERVREEILAARALVLPSFAEGLPVVIMEAMALGRPVVSTYIAGIPELVVPGETGWLAPAGDTAALADTLDAVLKTEVAVLEAMGRQGRERVLSRHDVYDQAAELVRLFGHTTGTRSHGEAV